MSEWRTISGFPDYEVSDDGQVRSWVKPGSARARRTVPLVLRQHTDARGYLEVYLRNGGASTKLTCKVHRLVATAFLGPLPNDLETRHLNGSSTDNRLVNLQYGTRSENACDTVSHGTHRNARKTHCLRGHAFDEINTYVPRRGGRHCRKCMAIRRSLLSETRRAVADREVA